MNTRGYLYKSELPFAGVHFKSVIVLFVD